jgi:DNA 3'-phosphatase
VWSCRDTCHYKLAAASTFKPGKLFFGFDYDDTLAYRSTDNVMAGVASTLQTLAKTHSIVVFSNQMGVEKNKTTNKAVQKLFDSFVSQVGVPVSLFYAISDDAYRKPMRGMFDLAAELSGVSALAVYCGDAGGRGRCPLGVIGAPFCAFLALWMS